MSGRRAACESPTRIASAQSASSSVSVAADSTRSAQVSSCSEGAVAMRRSMSAFTASPARRRSRTGRGAPHLGSEAEQPNGTIEKALVLNLDAPVCLPPSSENEDKQTDSIHIYSADDTLHGQLAAQRDKKTIVTVTGAGFLSHTAHHHRPIVVDVKRVTVE